MVDLEFVDSIINFARFNIEISPFPPILKTSRADIQNNLKDNILNELPQKLKKPLINEVKITSKGDSGRFSIRVGINRDQLKKYWMQDIFILITNKNDINYFAINFFCQRWPKDTTKFNDKNLPFYEECNTNLAKLSSDFFGNSYSIEENVKVEDKRITYQLKSTVEITEDINGEKMQNKLIDFISEWALLTVDFSRKIGFSDK